MGPPMMEASIPPRAERVEVLDDTPTPQQETAHAPALSWPGWRRLLTMGPIEFWRFVIDYFRGRYSGSTRIR